MTTFKQRPCTSSQPKERLITRCFLLTKVFTLCHTDLQFTAFKCICFFKCKYNIFNSSSRFCINCVWIRCKFWDLLTTLMWFWPCIVV